MAFTPKDNTGSLWVNNHPDRTGTIMVAGIQYYLNGWLKKTTDGKPFLSLSVKRKDEARSRGGLHKQDMNHDDIPFAPEWR
jgi:hypothetical protein